MSVRRGFESLSLRDMESIKDIAMIRAGEWGEDEVVFIGVDGAQSRNGIDHPVEVIFPARNSGNDQHACVKMFNRRQAGVVTDSVAQLKWPELMGEVVKHSVFWRNNYPMMRKHAAVSELSDKVRGKVNSGSAECAAYGIRQIDEVQRIQDFFSTSDVNRVRGEKAGGNGAGGWSRSPIWMNSKGTHWIERERGCVELANNWRMNLESACERLVKTAKLARTCPYHPGRSLEPVGSDPRA